MKNCPQCGAVNQEGAQFCTFCGAQFPLMRTQPSAYQQQDGYQQNGYQQNGYQQNGYQQNGYQQNGYAQGSWQQPTGTVPAYGGNRVAPQVNVTGIRPRSIPLAILFTFITFGIYGIYWMIKINDEVNQMANEPEATSGGLVFLFSLITLGIYSLYWLYKMGERCDRIKGDWNGSSPILYLVFGVIGLSIVSYALIQDTVNKCFPYSA